MVLCSITSFITATRYLTQVTSREEGLLGGECTPSWGEGVRVGRQLITLFLGGGSQQMNAIAQLIFSFLSSLRPQTIEWCPCLLGESVNVTIVTVRAAKE